MKKKLVFGVAAATLLSASAVLAGGPEIIPQPDYFSGFYVGGTVSIHNLVSDQSANFAGTLGTGDSLAQSVVLQDGLDPDFVEFVSFVIPPTLAASSTVDAGTIDVYGGVQGGFGKVFAHQFYLGVVGFGEWGKQQANSSATSTSPFEIDDLLVDFGGDPAAILLASTAEGTTDITLNVTTQITNDYGVAGKIGYLFTPTTMLYGKIGAVWANIKVKSSVSAEAQSDFSSFVSNIDDSGIDSTTIVSSDVFFNGSSSSSSTKTALLLGIGMEQFVYTDIVSVSLEYDYANFGTVSTTNNVAASGVFPSASRTSTNGVDTVTTVTGTTVVDASLPNALTASADAKISSFQAALNFYFGRDWI